MCLHASWAMYEAGGPRTGTSTRHESRVGSGDPLFCKIFLPEALRGQWHFNHFSPVQLGFDAQWQTSTEECCYAIKRLPRHRQIMCLTQFDPRATRDGALVAWSTAFPCGISFMVADPLHLRMARDSLS